MYRQTGLGGLPLALRLNEGLGVTALVATSTSDLALDDCHYSRPKGEDGQCLWVSIVGEVSPSFLFRLSFNVPDKGLMLWLANLVQDLTLGHAFSEKAAITSICRQGW